MKRMMLMSCLLICAVPFAARADHEIDWNRWYEGDVQVRLRVDRGEGALYEIGRPVRFRLEANEDAYHLVYAIDTDGSVRLLFPRAWEDDGWLFAGEELRLEAHDLAWPADRWGTGGIVYVEAVTSPVPFDFPALGVVFRAGHAGWMRQGRPFRVHGDPFLAFNDVHRVLFPDWEQAVFAVDYTYFYVGHRRDAPRYLGYTYQRVYLPPPTPVFSVGLRFVWHWEFGRRYCRPIYTRYYVPGRHVVHHHGYHHQHVVYTSSAPPRAHRRPAGNPWVAPERRRVAQDPPVVRQRQRPSVQPRRERDQTELPRVGRKRSAPSMAQTLRRSMEAKRETSGDTKRQTAAPAHVERTPVRRGVAAGRGIERSAPPARTAPRPAAQAARTLETRSPAVATKSRAKSASKSEPQKERREAQEKKRR